MAEPPNDDNPPKTPASPLRPPGPALAHRRDGLPKAPTPAPTRQLPARQIPLPHIKGRVLQKLAEAAPRTDEDNPLVFGESRHAVTIEAGPERGVLILAAVVFDALRKAGATRLPAAPLASALEKLVPTMTAEEMMSIEVEAYEALAWIGGALDPSLAPVAPDDTLNAPPIPFDPDAPHVALILRAIREGFDLEMAYYTGSRGELTHRRITPHEIEAEQYLKAYCHKRLTERVFRLSRIARVRPVGGVELRRPSPKPAAQNRRGQANLFDGPSED